jgi:PleD family two-component response regulator
MDEAGQSERRTHTSTVLVVDDDREDRELLCALLRPEGYRIVEAANGKEALAQATAERPDVVILDMMMPEMDGIEACRRLKSGPDTAPIPVLMLTGMTDRDSRIKGIEAGANDFLAKPADREEVVLRVRNAAHTKALYDELQEKFVRLRQMAELRDILAELVANDTQLISLVLDKLEQNESGSLLDMP